MMNLENDTNQELEELIDVPEGLEEPQNDELIDIPDSLNTDEDLISIPLYLGGNYAMARSTNDGIALAAACMDELCLAYGETQCGYYCQTTCLAMGGYCTQNCQGCQTGCQVSCQTGCEVTTQCTSTCQKYCQNCQGVACQTCQTTCQYYCQDTCELNCQDYCESYCQTGCQVSCQTGCQVAVQRPSNWTWSTSNITQGNAVTNMAYLTATEWNNFTARINSFRTYKGKSTVSFTAAVKGQQMTAAQANAAISAISEMNPSVAPPVTVSSGSPITAAFINGLASSLNSL